MNNPLNRLRRPKQPKLNPETANIDELWYYGDREADIFEKYRTINRTAAATLAGTVALSILTKNNAPAEVMAFSGVMSLGLYSARAGVMHALRVLRHPMKSTQYNRMAYRLGADVTSAALPLTATTAIDYIGRSIEAPTAPNIATASLAALISGASVGIDRWTGKRLRYQLEHVGETSEPLSRDDYVLNEVETPFFRVPASPDSPAEASNFEGMVRNQNPQNPESIFKQQSEAPSPPIVIAPVAPQQPLSPPTTVSPTQLGYDWRADS